MNDFSNTPIAELAGIVAEHLQQQGIQVVLVGGLAVEIYTENLYLTHDIDMVNTSYQKPTQMNEAMAQLGFKKQGRVYEHATTNITVEFPSAPISVGDELISKTGTVIVAGREIPVLLVSDVVKDRLAAYMHWKDNQSLVQAVAIMQKHQLTCDAFKAFCLHEGTSTQYDFFVRFYQAASNCKQTTMAALQQTLANMLLANI